MSHHTLVKRQFGHRARLSLSPAEVLKTDDQAHAAPSGAPTAATPGRRLFTVVATGDVMYLLALQIRVGNGDDGAAGVMQDALADRAQQHAGESAVAACADDQAEGML